MRLGRRAGLFRVARIGLDGGAAPCCITWVRLCRRALCVVRLILRRGCRWAGLLRVARVRLSRGGGASGYGAGLFCVAWIRLGGAGLWCIARGIKFGGRTSGM